MGLRFNGATGTFKGFAIGSGLRGLWGSVVQHVVFKRLLQTSAVQGHI